MGVFQEGETVHVKPGLTLGEPGCRRLSGPGKRLNPRLSPCLSRHGVCRPSPDCCCSEEPLTLILLGSIQSPLKDLPALNDGSWPAECNLARAEQITYDMAVA
ncbi:hypothetical protein NQZ68_007658 [Dissostichus eleginoides]|nr:hypothetical protein NQZ68_007658 [Dissostichus eleginoides]